MSEPDVVAELNEWLGPEPTGPRDVAAMMRRARDEIVALREGLNELVKLQSHYAALLNDYDGGARIQFESAEDWLRRLRTLKEKHNE